MMLLFCVKIFFYNENKPNTLPIELISIIKMQIGAKYFKKKLYSFFYGSLKIFQLPLQFS